MDICVEIDVLMEAVNLRDVGCQWRCSNVAIGFAIYNPNPVGIVPPCEKSSAPLLIAI